ncbi:MAG: hypothetical protein ACREU4_00180 [Burkholderiales bacterium]
MVLRDRLGLGLHRQLYLAPIFAVVLEYLLFGVVPSALTLVGIAVTCLGVALVTARA